MTQTYRLAVSGADYKLAHDFIKSQGIPDEPLNFPTMIAEDDTGVVAVLGTDTSQNQIVCGPLVLKQDRKRIFTLIGLIEAYDSVMRNAGVTEYIFAVDDTDGVYRSRIKDLTGIEPYANENGKDFFVRKL